MGIQPSYTLVVSRTCLHLYAGVVAVLGEQPEIRVILDRRYRERRQQEQPIREERRTDDRRQGMDMLLV